MVDFLLLGVICIIGVNFGFLFAILSGFTIELHQVHPSFFIGCILIVIFNAIFSKNSYTQNEERIRYFKLLSGSLAHDLRTPLTSIGLLLDAIREKLNKLGNNTINDLSASDAKTLLESPDKANAIITKALFFIQLTMKNLEIGNKADEWILSEIKMMDCLDEVLQSYPFQNNKEKVSYRLSKNLRFSGNKTAVVHVLYNLLENALFFIRKSHKGEIFIYDEIFSGKYQLHFKDTSEGIDPAKLPYIFDDFYTGREGGTGIGLSYCKMAMDHMGGSITCDSEKGAFTEFVLTFLIASQE